MGRTQLCAVLMLVCAVKCLAIPSNELEDFEDYIKRTSQLSPILKKGVEADEIDEDDALTENAWELSGKFEGDLILNERQRRLIVENVVEGLSRNGLRDGTKRWPNGEVIYFIQVEHFNSDQVQAILAGIEDLARASCVKFRNYVKGDRDAVVIQGTRPGCFSQVGYQGGYQVLNLSGRHPVGHGCFRHGTIVHEMLHTLGFYHMQSSPDRDDYIDVQWANIIPRARNNFRKYNSFTVSDFGIGYDYDSVLHYSRRAFSLNGMDTLVPKQNGADIGQRVGLSVKDSQKLNRMYCDVNSDPALADEINASKKKTFMNKPLDIYGLGYHQGKAVVFNVLPQVQQHALHTIPLSYMFDHFSKAPHILSTPKKEDIHVGKKIAGIYGHPGSINMHIHKMPVDIKTELQKHIHKVPQKQDDDHGHLNKEKHLKLPKYDMAHILKQEFVTDPFDRLSKIIKAHVYPSQNPDLSIYKLNKQNIERGDSSKGKVTKNNNEFKESVTIAPTGHQISQEEKMKSAMNFINSLYNSDKSENHHPPKENDYYEDDSKNNNKKHALLIIAELPDKKIRKNKYKEYTDPSPTMSFFEHEDDYEPAYYEPKTEHEGAFKKYPSKFLDGVHSEDYDSDDWLHKDTLHKHNPTEYDNEDYMDYVKHSTIRKGYYSPSVPIKIKEYAYHSPYESDRYNDVSHQEER